MRDRTMRPLTRVSTRLLAAVSLAALAGLSGCEISGAGKPGDVAGRYFLTAGDADMAGTALANKELGERDPGSHDTVTIVTMPLTEPKTSYAQAEVSNSALCPPTCLAVTKDGKYAFVVEYRGPAKADSKTIDDLPIGNKVTALDLSDPLKPTISAVIDLIKEPIAVAVHPGGAFIAVAAQTARKQIVIVPIKDGQFTGDPAVWPLIGVDNDEAKPTSICWHPGGEALAVTLQERGEVVFYRFRHEEGGGLQLAAWGDPVKAGKSPFAGAFTPDGKHFVVNDLQWGKDVDGYNVGAPEGQLIAIRVADMPGTNQAAEGGPSQHVVVSTVKVGVSPIGMAINSDGTMIATSNLQRSYLPDNDPRVNEQQRGGSISTVVIARDGTLTNVGEYPINAMPEGICFDANDRYLCVTQFRSFDRDAVDGEVGFWRVKKGWTDSHPTLIPADFFVGVGKGPHGVLVVR
jgi:DNA-binding beta-propeller fold protein YncE